MQILIMLKVLRRGLESLEGEPVIDQAATAVNDIAEVAYVPGTDSGLEAIIERFTRPVYLVQRSTFVTPADAFQDERGDRRPVGRRTGRRRLSA